MNNGWTGGQYSLFRFIFGCYLFCHFTSLLPWSAELFSSAGIFTSGELSPLFDILPSILRISDFPLTVTVLILSSSLAALCFALGFYDRISAVWIWFVLASLFGRNPLIANPSLPFVGWMLLAHSVLPSSPYGSISAINRVDPRGNWLFPKHLFLAAWALMALAYSYSGYTKLISPSWIDGTALAHVLENPLARPNIFREALLLLPAFLLQFATWGGLLLELLFAPLALIQRFRPFLWLGMVLLHFGLLLTVDFADLTLAMLVFHLFTFNPNWLSVEPLKEAHTIFYDGNCGLCHRAVRFVLAEDRNASFKFAPLQGDYFTKKVSKDERGRLPDSIVVLSVDGELHILSDAVVFLLKQLGGLWLVCGVLLALIPQAVRNIFYSGIAKVRHRIFTAPPEACPILPSDLVGRFVL